MPLVVNAINMEVTLPRNLGRQSTLASAVAYIHVLKPRETLLLAFVGIAAMVIAAGGNPPLDVLLIGAVAITVGCAGCNGLTNYLDRHLDARMRRTRSRPLPSGRIARSERVLPWAGGLVVAGFGLTLMLSPLAFFAALLGVVASLVGRRRALTHLSGGIFGSAPVLVGYFAIDPQLTPAPFILALLVATWVPLHVWSVMVAHRQDYLSAGVKMFPLMLGEKRVVWLLLACVVSLAVVSLAAAVFVDFGLIYISAALALGCLVIYVTARLAFFGGSQTAEERRRGAWRLYRISAFPYLGLLFIAMMVDLWV
jgi:protoheme IX farnesyltransferase